MRSIHIIGGLVGLVSGAIALVALKGAWIHRRSGMIFVISMMAATGTASVLALRQPAPGNVVAGVLTFYMVATALLTVRRPSQYAQTIDLVAMLGALALGSVAIGFGLLRDDPAETSGSYPPFVYFVFAAAAIGMAMQDRQMIAAGGLQGAARLSRHLGRMCGAMMVATASFFLGQPKVFAGGPLEPPMLRAVPVILVAAATIYWRVRMARRPLTLPERDLAAKVIVG